VRSDDTFEEASIWTTVHSSQGSVIQARWNPAHALCTSDVSSQLRVTTGEGVRGLVLSIVRASLVSCAGAYSDTQYVGEAESKALEARLLNLGPGRRPMTYELIVSVVSALGARVLDVRITHLLSNTYHASLRLLSPTGTLHVLDVRPSDGMNIAVRAGAPILVSTTLIRARGLRLAFSDESRSLPAPRPSHLDLAIEHRLRLALAVANGLTEQASRWRDAIAELLVQNARTCLGPTCSSAFGDDSVAARAAQLVLEIEVAVKEERWSDAAAARAQLHSLESPDGSQ